MASRRGDTFDKRQRERRRQEKASVKRARREGKEAPGLRQPSGPPIVSASSAEEADLLEMFAVLSQHHDAGGIDDATFAARRREIFGELGLAIPDDGLDPGAAQGDEDEDDLEADMNEDLDEVAAG